MRRQPNRRPLFDALEVRALLSVARLHTVHAAAVAGQNQVHVRQSGGSGTSVSTAVETGLQQQASGSNLEIFLSELAAAEGTRGDVQQYAQAVLAGHQTSDLEADMLARARGVILPSNITTTQGQALARQVLAAVGTSSFDTTYLSAMAQANTQGVALDQSLVAQTTGDAALQSFEQSQLATDQMHLAGAQALANNQPSGLPAPPAAAAGNLASGDFQYLQQASSTNGLEILLSQAAALNSTSTNVQQYASKLISDHEQSALMLEAVALARGATTTPGLSSSDQATARQVLASVGNPTAYDQAYLSANVQTHTMDIASNQQALGTLQNPSLRQYAQDDLGTDFLHLIGAQTLLNGGTSGTSPANLSGFNNVRERLSHPGNGTLRYTLSFNDGSNQFTQTYSLNIHRVHGRQAQNNPISGVQAVQLFLQQFEYRFAQFQQGKGLGGTGTGMGSTPA